MHATGNKRTGGKTWLEKVRCPECGTLCWQRPEDAGVVKASHLDGAVCTKCALRKAGDVVRHYERQAKE